MDFKQKLWDEMDVIFADDTTIPEGKEIISERDFDRILQESEDEDESKGMEKVSRVLGGTH